jgi:hypothetical protein
LKPTAFSVKPPADPTPEPEPPAAELEDEIDENDPLWLAVLKISNGDRTKAKVGSDRGTTLSLTT